MRLWLETKISYRDIGKKFGISWESCDDDEGLRLRGWGEDEE